MANIRNWAGRFVESEAHLSTAARTMFIAVASLSIKLAYIMVLGGGLSAFPSEGSDAAFYNWTAYSILKTGIYAYTPGQATVAMPPGEPFFLALLYGMSNNSIALAKLAHVALLTAAAILTFFTGKALADASVGFWAGLLIAIDPAQAYLSGTFLSEPLFIFWMTLGIFLLVRERPRWNWISLVCAGLCFGLAGLTRNQGWLFAAALTLGALAMRERLMPLRAAALVLIASVAIIAPWTWRNYQVTGQLILISVNDGLNLWSGNNPDFTWRQPMPMSLPIYQVPTGLSETETDSYYRERAIEWITGHQADFWLNGARKVLMLYNSDPVSWREQVAEFYRLAGVVPYGMLLPFIMLGLAQNLRNEKYSIVLGYIFFTTAMAFVFYGDSRIRAPIQPYLYLFGVLGLQPAWRWYHSFSHNLAPSSIVEHGTNEPTR
jgi:4-amino-4-deoxy-L-arabinose transferase-like glycosyltransferase